MAKPTLPIEKDFVCYKGQSWTQSIRYYIKSGDTRTVWNMTGFTAKAEIRPSENSPVLTADLHANVTGVDGLVSLALTPEETAEIKPGFYYYDVRTIQPNGKTRYWLKGQFLVIGRVTA